MSWDVERPLRVFVRFWPALDDTAAVGSTLHMRHISSRAANMSAPQRVQWEMRGK